MTMTATPPSAPQRWQRASGVQLLGLVNGSGLNHSTYLVRRADGQVVQLTELLHSIVREAARPLPSDELARRVSSNFGRELDVEGLTLLAKSKLEPLGLLERPGKSPAAPPPSAAPLLALTVKATVLRANHVERIASVLSKLYAPPVVVLACLALIALDARLFLGTDVVGALASVLLTPALLLLLFALVTVGGLVHEVGHAAACRYGGGTPGVIGVGLYLVFPAFFTDVTDSYRLSRAGRIRTDLGGLYFHLWWVLCAGGAYLLTGSPLFLLLVIATQLQMAQQLPPTIRLDGYFVLSDLAGIPDLFARVAPVLRSLIPGRPTDPRVRELRPTARRIVTAWVLAVVPFLAGVLAWLAVSLPAILTETATAGVTHMSRLSVALALGQPFDAAMSILAMALLALPAVGSLLIIARLTASIIRVAAGRMAPPVVRYKPRHATTPGLFRLGYHF
ncbi:hypothetical protein [Sinomonas humi]|uniref:hypothetical protein n=1 Tax=Sinomonas humi TaxID=1338436 RepID=UPI00068E8C87|nr:hypothetical protein [Sinomonas humi]